MAVSARRDSPLPVSSSASVFVPIAPPRTNAMTTNASQPKMAVLRWRALQWPARAARFLLGLPADSRSGGRFSLACTGLPYSGAPPNGRWGQPEVQLLGAALEEKDEQQDDDDDGECSEAYIHALGPTRHVGVLTPAG